MANRSVDFFCDDGGSQSIRVTGYEWLASAVFVNSSCTSPCMAPGVSGSGCVRYTSMI